MNSKTNYKTKKAWAKANTREILYTTNDCKIINCQYREKKHNGKIFCRRKLKHLPPYFYCREIETQIDYINGGFMS